MLVITHEIRAEYWSNTLGWTPDLHLASKFTASQAPHVQLPMQGEWMPFEHALAVFMPSRFHA